MSACLSDQSASTALHILAVKSSSSVTKSSICSTQALKFNLTFKYKHLQAAEHIARLCHM